MKLTCPFCYEQFNASKILYRCENADDNRCAKENDEELAIYFGQPTFPAKRIIDTSNTTNTRQRGKGVRCDQCNKPTSKQICPCCHNQLPTFFHQSESHVISVIGARNSGKTHYITVLINELVRRGHLLKIDTIPQDVGENRNEVTSMRYRRNYKRPLIDQHTELPQTQENAKDLYPLIYQLKSSRKSIFDKFKFKKKVLYLTFYDTAGENFRDAQELKKIANYVSNSSGVIFLVDSFQIPLVNRHLSDSGMKLPNHETGYDDVLNQLINLFEGSGEIREAGSVANIPVAITLSKFDEVLKHSLLNVTHDKLNLSSNSSFLNHREFSPSEIQEVSDTIRTNLVEWDEEGFANKLDNQFKNLAYFGISALGDSPENGRLHGAPVPYRVMDPLIWILHKLNFQLPLNKK